MTFGRSASVLAMTCSLWFGDFAFCAPPAAGQSGGTQFIVRDPTLHRPVTRKRPAAGAPTMAGLPTTFMCYPGLASLDIANARAYIPDVGQ